MLRALVWCSIAGILVLSAPVVSVRGVWSSSTAAMIVVCLLVFVSLVSRSSRERVVFVAFGALTGAYLSWAWLMSRPGSGRAHESIVQHVAVLALASTGTAAAAGAACWVSCRIMRLFLDRRARARRRRARAQRCTDCGYNLTGNTSGRCPECGLIIHARSEIDAVR